MAKNLLLANVLSILLSNASFAAEKVNDGGQANVVTKQVTLYCAGLNAQVVGGATGLICREEGTLRPHIVSLVSLGVALHFSADFAIQIRCKTTDEKVAGVYRGGSILGIGYVIDGRETIAPFVAKNGSSCEMSSDALISGAGIGIDFYSKARLFIW